MTQQDNYHTIKELQAHVKALGGQPAKTMDELYSQRTELSIALFNGADASRKWKFVSEPGWIAYGITVPGVGDMGYHAPDSYLDQIQAPITEPFSIDGNTLERIQKWKRQGYKTYYGDQRFMAL